MEAMPFLTKVYALAYLTEAYPEGQVVAHPTIPERWAIQLPDGSYVNDEDVCVF